MKSSRSTSGTEAPDIMPPQCERDNGAPQDLTARRLKRVLGVAIVIMISWLLGGCASSAPSYVGENRTESNVAAHESQKKDSTATESSSARMDKVTAIDTVIVDRTVVVREADSSELAKYGIRLANQQRAYVIMEKEMRERISRLEQLLRDSVGTRQTNLSVGTVRDSISSSISQDTTTEKKEEKRSFGLLDLLYAISPLLTLAVVAWWEKKRSNR